MSKLRIQRISNTINRPLEFVRDSSQKHLFTLLIAVPKTIHRIPPLPLFPDVTSKLKPHQRCTTIIAASRLICDDAIRSQQTMPYELLIDSPKSAVSSPRSVLWRTQTKKVVAAYEFGEGRPAFLFCARGQNEFCGLLVKFKESRWSWYFTQPISTLGFNTYMYIYLRAMLVSNTNDAQ